jgi:hypothetical protein
MRLSSLAALLLPLSLLAAGCAGDEATPATDPGTADEADLQAKKTLAARATACEDALYNAEDQSTAGMVQASGVYQTCVAKAVDAQKIATADISALRAIVPAVCAHKSAASGDAFGTLNRVESASCPGAREFDVAYLLDTYGPKQTSKLAQTQLETDTCQAAFDTATNGGDAPQQELNQAIGVQNECYVQQAIDSIVAGLAENVAYAKSEGYEDIRFTETYAGDAKAVRAEVEGDIRSYNASIGAVCASALRASGEDGGSLGVFLVGACRAHVFLRYLPLRFARRHRRRARVPAVGSASRPRQGCTTHPPTTAPDHLARMAS